MFEVMLSGNVSTVLGDTLVVLISMTLLLFLVKFFAWDKVNAMLEARRDKIAKDLDEAAEKRKSAEEIQANANEIIHNAEVKGSEILDNAREAASKTQDEMIKEGKDVVSRMKADGQREVDSMKKAEFMMDKVGEEFDGIISSVVKFGLFIELPNTVEGLIHINELKQDYFHFVENHLALVGERTGLTFKIGQKVRVKVVKADPDERAVDFELVSAEEVTALERPKTRNGKSGKREGKQAGKRPERGALGHGRCTCRGDGRVANGRVHEQLQLWIIALPAKGVCGRWRAAEDPH